MSWMVRRDNLGPQQMRILNSIANDGNFLVTGDPGTGKSIVLAHAALEWKIMHPGARICVITYTNALVSNLESALRDYAIPTMTFHRFMSSRERVEYDLVLVDEVQDLQQDWADRIQRRGHKFVFFGDFGQCLYGAQPNLFDDANLVTKEILLDMFNIHETFNLETDYRLPMNCRKLCQCVFPNRRFTSDIHRLMANVQIQLFRANNWDEEMEFVTRTAKNYSVAGRPTGILFEAKRRIFRFFYTILGDTFNGRVKLETINDELRNRNLPFRFLGNRIGDFSESNQIPLSYIMTWHSAKGLDFETVIIPDVGDSACRDNPLYVALTRTRRNLIITYSGRENATISEMRTCDAVHSVAEGSTGRSKNERDSDQQLPLF